MSDTKTVDPAVTAPPKPPDPQTNGKSAGGAKTSTDPEKPPFKAATFRQKVVLSAYLFFWVALLLPLIWVMIDRLNASALAEVSVAWEMPPGVTLDPGPAAFQYDATQKKLIHYGVITAERKLELRALLAPARPEAPSAKPEAAASPTPKTTPTKPRTGSASPAEKTAETGPTIAQMDAYRRSYSQAIDNLAYLGTVRQGAVISMMLILGGLGGALGAILRSLGEFAANASYYQQLDLSRWWPLYFTRPLVGGIIGFVLIILTQAQLLTGGNLDQGAPDSFWWLGVAVLGGFSTMDVTTRLRMAAKALFGGGGEAPKDKAKDEAKGEAKDEAKEAAKEEAKKDEASN
jgi:hypothetical protein